jgi:hypothetical protein
MYPCSAEYEPILNKKKDQIDGRFDFSFSDNSFINPVLFYKLTDKSNVAQYS